jgi:hypothetical protein
MGLTHASTSSMGQCHSPAHETKAAAGVNLLDPRSPSYQRTPLSLWQRASTSREEVSTRTGN